METFTEMEGGSMESAVAFDLIDSDDSEDVMGQQQLP